MYACDKDNVPIQVARQVCCHAIAGFGGVIVIKLPVELGVIDIYACTKTDLPICLYVALLTVNADVVIPQSLAGVRFVHEPVKF